MNLPGTSAAAAIVGISQLVSAGVVLDFEGSTLPATISPDTAHSTAIVSSNYAHTGEQSLKWTYTDNGVAWGNEVRLVFPSGQSLDWSSYDKIRIWFYIDSTTATVTSPTVYFGYTSNGKAVGGTGGTGAFAYNRTTSGWQYFDISLVKIDPDTGLAYLRNSVTQIKFYLSEGNFSNGANIFYVDDISVYSSAVPEAATLGTIGVAGGIMLLTRRRPRITK